MTDCVHLIISKRGSFVCEIRDGKPCIDGCGKRVTYNDVRYMVDEKGRNDGNQSRRCHTGKRECP